MKCSIFCLLALFAYTLAVPLRQNNTECLSKLDASKKDSRIAGGTSTTIQHLPWNLSFRLQERHYCGAAIISANRALTGARCWDWRFELRHYNVLANSTTHAPAANGVVVGVTRFVRHPRNSLPKRTFNLAVLYLANSLIFGPGMRPIALPLAGAAIPYGTDAIVSGWGYTIDGTQGPDALAPDLQYTTITLIRTEACRSIYPDHIAPNMVCASGLGRGACAGDIGAPLVANGLLVGVHSWHIGCGRNIPGVYSSISHVDNANFIRSHLD